MRPRRGGFSLEAERAEVHGLLNTMRKSRPRLRSSPTAREQCTFIVQAAFDRIRPRHQDARDAGRPRARPARHRNSAPEVRPPGSARTRAANGPRATTRFQYRFISASSVQYLVPKTSPTGDLCAPRVDDRSAHGSCPIGFVMNIQWTQCDNAIKCSSIDGRQGTRFCTAGCPPSSNAPWALHCGSRR